MARTKERHDALVAIAADQGGYFSARQALTAGYAYPRQHYHVRAGNWEHAARGVFRLRDYPQPERADLIVLALLSQDRAGIPQAVVSHETALALHGLSDANPARIHLSVPPGFRRQLPDGVELHRAMLGPDDWEERDGFRITTPLRTLVDVAASPTAWPYLHAAVADALARGLVRRHQLELVVAGAEMASEARDRLRAALAESDVATNAVGGMSPRGVSS